MALPRMDADPTTRTPTRGPRDPLIPDTPVGIARARLWESGEHAAVVADHGRPVGIVTSVALEGAPGPAGQEAPVHQVMDLVAVPVDTHADAATTVCAFQRAAWDWLLRRG
jgi:CBS domain-containing protein